MIMQKTCNLGKDSVTVKRTSVSCNLLVGFNTHLSCFYSIFDSNALRINCFCRKTYCLNKNEVIRQPPWVPWKGSHMLCHKYTWRVLQNGISEGKSSNYQISCFMWQLFILTKTKILTENCLKTLPETFAIYWFFIIYIGKLIKQNLQKIFHVQWSSFSYYLATFSKKHNFLQAKPKTTNCQDK